MLLCACGNKPTAEELAKQAFQHPGLLVYQAQCASCHQNNGEGVKGSVPSLVGVDWVTAEKPRLIRLMLHGVEGAMTVKNERYDSVMQSFAQLDDQDLADVLTFIRKSWGNNAAEITPAEVRTLRLYHRDRNKPWTPEELNETAQKTMPALAVANE